MAGGGREVGGASIIEEGNGDVDDITQGRPVTCCL